MRRRYKFVDYENEIHRSSVHFGISCPNLEQSLGLGSNVDLSIRLIYMIPTHPFLIVLVVELQGPILLEAYRLLNYFWFSQTYVVYYACYHLIQYVVRSSTMSLLYITVPSNMQVTMLSNSNTHNACIIHLYNDIHYAYYDGCTSLKHSNLTAISSLHFAYSIIFPIQST